MTRLVRQRRGVTPEMLGRYPDYDVLSQAEHWDAVTRRVVLDRVGNVPPFRFFDEREQATLTVLCDRLPARAVVWAVTGSKESRLIQPVHAFCDVPTAQAPAHAPRRLVTRFARRLARDTGRPLYVVAARRPPLVRIAADPGQVERVVVLHYTKLEESVVRRPLHRIRRRFAVYLVRM